MEQSPRVHVVTRVGKVLGVVFGVVLIGPILAVAAAQEIEAAHLSLLDAVQRALGSYPSLRASQAAGDEARATAGEAEAARAPTVRVEGSATQYQEPAAVTPIHGFAPGLVPPFDETLIQGGVSLAYKLFDGGTRGARILGARAQVHVADAERDTVGQALVARVVRTYLATAGQRQIRDAHDQRLTALDAERARVRRRYDAGRAARVETLRVDAALAAAQADRVRAEEAVDRSERDLARLIGAPADQVAAVTLDSVAFVESAIPSRDQLKADALQFSPTMAAARGKLRSAEVGVDLARSARWPDLNFSGSYVDRGSRRGDYEAEWLAGLQLSYALFDGGARGRAIDRAEAVHRNVVEQMKLIELQVEEDIDRALSAIREARARVESLVVAVARAEEVARIEQLLLETGSGTQTDFLGAETDLLAVRADLVDARHAEIAARVDLARVRGDLNVAWLTRMLPTP